MLKNFSKTLLIIFVFIFPLATNAARLYFDPAEVTLGPGDSMELKVKVDVTDACINTVDARIEYPADYIFIREFTTGDSILSIWVNQPSSKDIEEMNRNNKIEFTGGIPGGYCGRIPGDPGESNIIGRVVFTVPGMIVADEDRDQAEIHFSDDTKVYLNDGLGTEAELMKGFVKVNLAGTRQTEDFDLDGFIGSDTIPPEPFVIELMKNPNLYDGAYHINFYTVDKQTGIDHYEILEIRPNEEVGIAPAQKWWERFVREAPAVPVWTIGKMPYVLQDQALKSIVKVKAVDKAGNERLVEYIPPLEMQKEEKTTLNVFLIMVLLLIIIIFIVLIWLAIRLIKKIKHKSPANGEENNYEEEKNITQSGVDSDSLK